MGGLAVDASLVDQQAGGSGEDVGVGVEAEQLGAAAPQQRQRQVGVPLALGLCEREGRRRLGAAVGLARDVGGERDQVGAREADPVDLGQPVGVLVQDPHRLGAVAGVDRGREVGEAVRRELDVKVADRAAGVPALRRGFGLAGAYPAQGGEDRGRVGGDRLQHRLAVAVGQPLGAGGADVAQRGQVGDLPVAVGGVKRLRAAGPKLRPVARVLLPLAAHLGTLAGAQVPERPDHRELVAGVLVGHRQHRVAVLLGAEELAPHPDGAGVGAAGVAFGLGDADAARLKAGADGQCRSSRNA